MPPKAKFTKQEIINAGLQILRKSDISCVTAREIAKCLHTSPRPIFTTFKNMNEVIEGIEKEARNIYSSYVHEGLKQDLAFKGVGNAYITFAIKEPKLFQLLFMRKQDQEMGINKILPEIEDNYEEIVKSISDNYPVDRETAIELYRHLWIYSHGIATLCATSMCKFTGEEIGALITEAFISLLKKKMSEKQK